MKLTGKPSIDKPWLQYYPEESINEEIPYENIYTALVRENKNFKTIPALNYFGRKITYEEMFENIDDASRALIAFGVKKGDVVTIISPTLPETSYVFLALAKIGAISNMVDPRTSPEGIEEYINEAESKLIFIIDSYAYKLKDLKNKTEIQDIITFSPSDSLPFGLKMGYELKAFLEKKKGDTPLMEDVTPWKKFISKKDDISKDYHFEEVDASLPAVIEHTGGTTGTPKGVLLSHYNLLSTAYQCIYAGFDFQRKQTWLNIMPLFIAYGAGNGFLLPLLCGMEVILIPAFDPNKFANLLNKYKPNHMIGVPSHYGHIIKSPLLAKADLSYVIAPTVGGDAMDKKLEIEVNDFLEKHNCPYKIVKGYGMTEVNAAVAACNSNESNTLGSVGIPFPQTTISVFAPGTTKELGYNEEGEVCITGPNTMLGYWKNQKATDDIIWQHEDGKKWVHSGDLGYINENGQLFIMGRIKRMIVRHDGFKIFPPKIEEVISEIPAISSCQVVGFRDLAYAQGELPMVHVILKEEYHGMEEEVKSLIMKICHEKLQEYAIPYDVVFEEKFPLTLLGKIDFKKLSDEDNERMAKVAPKKLTKTK